MIGCSPEELTAALAASDKTIAKEMKNILKQFQVFLINFEVSSLGILTELFSASLARSLRQLKCFEFNF